MRRIIYGITLFLSFATPTAAQEPPTTLIAGTMTATASGFNCNFEPGASTFQRDGSDRALVTLPQFAAMTDLFNQRQYIKPVGQVTLEFAPAGTRGTAAFEQPPDLSVPFTFYNQSYFPLDRRLVVRFRMTIGLCDYNMKGVYRH